MPTNARAPLSGVSRRSLLAAFGAGGVAIVLTGCSTPAPAKTADVVAATNPLGPLYTEALALLSQYDQAIAGNPTITGLLGPLREETRQHAIAIASLMGAATPPIAAGPSPSGLPVPTGSAAVPVHPAASSAPPTSAPPTSAPPTTGATGLPTTDATAPSSPGATDLPSGLPSAPPSTVTGGNPIEAKASLAAAEKAAQAKAVSACLAARQDQVAVLASITASRATHVVALS